MNSMGHLHFFIWFAVFSVTLVVLIMHIILFKKDTPHSIRTHLLLLISLLCGIFLRFLFTYSVITDRTIPSSLFYPIKYTLDGITVFLLFLIPYHTFNTSPPKFITSIALLIGLSFSLGIFLWPGKGYSLQRSITYTLAALHGLVLVFKGVSCLSPGPQRSKMKTVGLVCAAGTVTVLLLYTLAPGLIQKIHFFLFLSFALIWDIASFLLLKGAPTPAGTSIQLPDNLTPREKEILNLILNEGISNKTIADRLYISPFTVKRHIASICEKSGVSTKLKLTALYSKNNHG